GSQKSQLLGVAKLLEILPAQLDVGVGAGHVLKGVLLKVFHRGLEAAADLRLAPAPHAAEVALRDAVKIEESNHQVLLRRTGRKGAFEAGEQQPGQVAFGRIFHQGTEALEDLLD